MNDSIEVMRLMRLNSSLSIKDARLLVDDGWTVKIDNLDSLRLRFKFPDPPESA